VEYSFCFLKLSFWIETGDFHSLCLFLCASEARLLRKLVGASPVGSDYMLIPPVLEARYRSLPAFQILDIRETPHTKWGQNDLIIASMSHDIHHVIHIGGSRRRSLNHWSFSTSRSIDKWTKSFRSAYIAWSIVQGQIWSEKSQYQHDWTASSVILSSLINHQDPQAIRSLFNAA